MTAALPSLRQLSYLVALQEHGNFGRAAASCFVTQSALSVGIADLEKTLGVTLVERSKRHLRFTSLGEDLVVRARAIAQEVDDLCETARASTKPLSGTIRLSVIPTVAPFILPRMLPAIRNAWPDLTLQVREKLTGQACEELQRGWIDCVLLALPIECGDVEVIDITVDRLFLGVCATEAATNLPVTLDDIDIERLLLLEDGHCLKDHALAACERTTQSSGALLVASTLHTLVQMVDAGLGITLIPEMAVNAGILAGTKVRGHPLLSAGAERKIALVYRRRSARAQEFGLLAATIRSSFENFGTRQPTSSSAHQGLAGS